MADIHLTEQDRAFVEEQVNLQIYKDADAVVAAGLRLLGSEEGKLAELRRLIQEGLDDVEAGRTIAFKNGEELTTHILRMAEERKNAITSAGDVAPGSGRSSRNL